MRIVTGISLTAFVLLVHGEANDASEASCTADDLLAAAAPSRIVFHNGCAINLDDPSDASAFPTVLQQGLNVTILNKDKKLWYVRSFLSSRDAATVRGFCSGNDRSFARSPLSDAKADDGSSASIRTSSSCPLLFAYFYMPHLERLEARRPELVPELKMVWNMTQRAAELLPGVDDVAQMEPFQMLRYQPGEFYREHHDHRGYYDPVNGYPDRPTTMLLFLNTLPTSAGGQLRFGKLGWDFYPVEGDAVIWSNVRDEDGRADPDMVHQGMPPLTEGAVKLAINIWARDKPFTSPQQAAQRQH